jgi:hypothetical protein
MVDMGATTSLPRRLLLSFLPAIVVLLVLVPASVARWDGTPPPADLPPVEQPPAPAEPSDEATAAGPLGVAAAAVAGPIRAVTMTAVGQTNLGGRGYHGNVWAHDGFAYVGTWGSGTLCPATGVKVVDLSDPANPRQVGVLAAYPNTTQEHIVVRRVDTPRFRGDLLAVGIQLCGGGGRRGLALFDVTDPRSPVELGFYDSGASGVHELDMVVQGSRVLALLAVPYSESRSGGQGDFRIVDVTDPRRPVQLSHWGVWSGLGLDPAGGVGCQARSYAHSAKASADASRAYVSYWDAGVVVLDISDPTRPAPLARLAPGPNDTGATHSVAEADGGRYLLIADEESVFRTPYGLRFRVDGPSGPLDIRGCEALFSRRLEETGVIDASIVNAGSGCPNQPLAFDPRGRVAVVDDGGCALGEKAARLAAAGALAMVIGERGGPVSLGGGARVAMPVIIVDQAAAAALRAATAAGPASVRLPTARPWSGLRIWEIADLATAREVGRFQTPNSLAFPPPTNGFYTIHNPLVVDDLAFLSWYSDGLRVLDISDPSQPREVGAYVPPAARNPQGGFFPDQTMVWGVAVTGDLVLVSDVNSGLHVLRMAVER